MPRRGATRMTSAMIVVHRPVIYSDRKKMQNLADNRDRIDALIAAFAAAEYLVDVGPRPIALRLSRQTPALDRILGGRTWAIVTAHNPDGHPQTHRRNAAAHATLEACLDRIAPAMRLPACNRDPKGRWPDEPGWLFTPEDVTQADRLARRFGQRAIVTGGAGQRAELRIYDARCTALPDFARIVRA